jgi:hypothetical protein
LQELEQGNAEMDIALTQEPEFEQLNKIAAGFGIGGERWRESRGKTMRDKMSENRCELKGESLEAGSELLIN